MKDTNNRLARFTTFFAAMAAAGVVILIPAAYFAFGYRYNAGEIAAEMTYLSQRVSHIVGHNPQIWRFEAVRIEEIVTPQQHDTVSERRTVFDQDGSVVARIMNSDDWNRFPVIGVAGPLYDSGAVAGSILIERSLRPLLMRTGFAALISLFLGGGVFFVLRTLPLRALQSAVARISFLASHDGLTGLPNRELFADRLQQAILVTRRGKGQLMAVLALDLDRFKDINDTLGHHQGDQLLKKAAERLKSCLRESDTLARLSGDEFAIVQTGIEQPEEVAVLARRIVEFLSEPFVLGSMEASVGVSVGIALFPNNSETAKELMLNADTALYRAKSDGRGTFCFFEEEMNEKLRVRRRIERDLRTALAHGGFAVSYQPQFEMGSGRMMGVEALLRWPHADHGYIPPDQFVPIAEDSGLIIPIGEWVLRKACSDAKKWKDVRVAVNLSPVQFRQPFLAAKVAQILADTGLAPTRLELEITEGILLHDTETTIETLKQIKMLGVHIAMDDFGTGYSSLSYLRRFPFDKIKVDRSFIAELGTADDADAIVKAAINLAHSLGMRANAEGVETQEQLEKLLALGCEEVQGFLYSKAVTAAEIDGLIDKAAQADAGDKEARRA